MVLIKQSLRAGKKYLYPPLTKKLLCRWILMLAFRHFISDAFQVQRMVDLTEKGIGHLLLIGWIIRETWLCVNSGPISTYYMSFQRSETQ